MIRLANKDDITKINELGLLVTPNFLSTYNIEEYINNSKYIILVDDDVNGFLLVFKNIDSYEIEMIVVDEKNRKKKVATNLLTHFIEKYVKINDIVLLEVSSKNEIALNLYKKFNFNIINIRKNYYKNEDAYIMKRVK